ncbi:hypothetical protein ACHAQH_004854 [Verticillium albo-atrum]
MNIYPYEKLFPNYLPPAHVSHPANEGPSMTPSTWEMPSTIMGSQPGYRSPTSSEEESSSSAEDYESVEPLSETSEEDERGTSDGETRNNSGDEVLDVLPAGGQDDGDWHVVGDAAGPDPDRTVATLLNMLCALDRQVREFEARRIRMRKRRGEVERELLRTQPWALALEITGEEAFWWERREERGGPGVGELRGIDAGLEGVERGIREVGERRERVVRLLVVIWGGGV